MKEEVKDSIAFPIRDEIEFELKLNPIEKPDKWFYVGGKV